MISDLKLSELSKMSGAKIRELLDADKAALRWEVAHACLAGVRGAFKVLLKADYPILQKIVAQYASVYPQNIADLYQQARWGLWEGYKRLRIEKRGEGPPQNYAFYYMRSYCRRYQVYDASCVRFSMSTRFEGRRVAHRRMVRPFYEAFVEEGNVDSILTAEASEAVREALTVEANQEALDEADWDAALKQIWIWSMQDLPRREQRVLVDRFSENPSTLEEIAVRLGFTRERIRQIQRDSLAVLWTDSKRVWSVRIES